MVPYLYFVKYLFYSIFCSVVFWVGYSPNVFAQGIEHISWEIIGDEYKLSNKYASEIEQDKFGFLWVGTPDGLNRFDGNYNKIFRHIPGDSTSLIDDSFQALFKDSNGDIWITYRTNIVSRFDYKRQCFIHFDFNQRSEFKKFQNGFQIFHFDKDSILWYGAYKCGLNAIDLKTGKVRQWDLPDLIKRFGEKDAFSYNSVNFICPKDHNSFWVATYCGLYTFDFKSYKFEHVSFALQSPNERYDFFNHIVQEGDSILWLASFGGMVYSYDIRKKQFKEFSIQIKLKDKELNSPVTYVKRKSDHELWIIQFGKGLGIFNTLNGEVAFFNSEIKENSEFNLSSISSLCILDDGVIFAQCKEGLLKSTYKSKLFHFKNLRIPNIIYENLFGWGSLYEDTLRKQLYIGTLYASGFIVLDLKTGKMKNFEVDEEHKSKNKFMRVNDVIMDHRGKVWLTSDYNVYEYDTKRQKLIKLINLIEGNDKNHVASFWNIEADSDNEYWAVSNAGTVHQFYPEKSKFSPSLSDLKEYKSIPKGISRIRVNPNGTIWFGMNNNFALFDKKKKEARLALDSLHSLWIDKNPFNAMDNDPDGNLWIATRDKGLMKISVQADTFLVQLIDSSKGLPYQKILNICVDPLGHVWIATINGLYYYKPDENQFRLFSSTEGMHPNYREIKFIKDFKNSLYLTVPGSFAKVDFNLINKRITPPKIYLTSFRVRNVERTDFLIGDPIVLLPNDNFFSFEFGCIDFTNQHYDQFAYMLEGWDDDWVYCGSRRYASFNNLEHGNYVFKVKVSGPDGVWGEPLNIPVHIKTHFYKKAWFSLLTIFVLSGIIFSMYRYRITQVKKAERIKTDFNRQITDLRMEALRAQMNPHFIFNCLNSINRYIIKSDIKTSSLYLTRFAKLMRLILDNSEYKKVVLSNELEALKLYIEMESLRFDHKFTYEIKLDDTVDADNIEIPPLIIQPYVENAIWHGLLPKDSGGHLSIQLSQIEGELQFTITDNGIGRQKAMDFKSQSAPTRKSLGMKLTQERLQMASKNLEKTGSQNIIDLDDEFGNPAGTQVILTIPI